MGAGESNESIDAHLTSDGSDDIVLRATERSIDETLQDARDRAHAIGVVIPVDDP